MIDPRVEWLADFIKSNKDEKVLIICSSAGTAISLVKQIKAITGHKTLKEVSRYTAAADQKHLAQQAKELLLRAEHEQKLSNFEDRLDKTEAK